LIGRQPIEQVPALVGEIRFQLVNTTIARLQPRSKGEATAPSKADCTPVSPRALEVQRARPSANPAHRVRPVARHSLEGDWQPSWRMSQPTLLRLLGSAPVLLPKPGVCRTGAGDSAAPEHV